MSSLLTPTPPEQSGGTFFYTDEDVIVFVIAHVNPNHPLMAQINYCNSQLSAYFDPSYQHPPHMTLFELHWNHKHMVPSKFDSLKSDLSSINRGVWHELVDGAFGLINNLSFKALPKYKAFGPSQNFIVKEYEPTYAWSGDNQKRTDILSALVSDFRSHVINYFSEKLGQPLPKPQINQEDKSLYYGDIFTVPQYYVQPIEWKPHLSIATLNPWIPEEDIVNKILPKLKCIINSTINQSNPTLVNMQPQLPFNSIEILIMSKAYKFNLSYKTHDFHVKTKLS